MLGAILTGVIFALVLVFREVLKRRLAILFAAVPLGLFCIFHSTSNPLPMAISSLKVFLGCRLSESISISP